MKTTPMELLVEDPERALREMGEEDLVLVRGGRPVALLVSLENRDEEDLLLGNDPGFWRMIQARREKNVLVPFDEAMARLSAIPPPAE